MEPIALQVVPPSYNPKNISPQDFINKFELAAIANNWHEHEYLTQFPTFLNNTSQLWYSVQTDIRIRENLTKYTWSELK